MASERTKYVSLNSPSLASLQKGTASSPIVVGDDSPGPSMVNSPVKVVLGEKYWSVLNLRISNSIC